METHLNAQCDCQSGWICPKCADEMRRFKADLHKLADTLREEGRSIFSGFAGLGKIQAADRIEELLNRGK